MHLLTIDAQVLNLARMQLQDAKFMPKAGFIGYHCRHLYPVSKESPDLSEACLKGCDAAFLATASLLGLKSEFFAIWNKNADKNDDNEDEDEDDDNWNSATVHIWPPQPPQKF